MTRRIVMMIICRLGWLQDLAVGSFREPLGSRTLIAKVAAAAAIKTTSLGLTS